MNQYVINRTVPTLIWGREDDDFHTRISLFNYYSLLFPTRLSARSLISTFGEDGQELGHVQETLDPLQQWQSDLSGKLRSFEAASVCNWSRTIFLPSNTIGILGTLFSPPIGIYRGIVILLMKQTGCVLSRIPGCSTNPPPFRRPTTLTLSIVVQNSFFGEDDSQCDRSWDVEIRDGDGKQLMRRSLSLAPRASIVVPLQDLLPDYRRRLGGRAGSIHVKGRHINQPLDVCAPPER